MKGMQGWLKPAIYVKTHTLHLVNNTHVLRTQNTVQNSHEKDSSKTQHITWDLKNKPVSSQKYTIYCSGIQQESIDTGYICC